MDFSYLNSGSTETTKVCGASTSASLAGTATIGGLSVTGTYGTCISAHPFDNTCLTNSDCSVAGECCLDFTYT